MTTVRVSYHHEPEGWWAESPDVAGFVASGSTLREVRALAHEGLPFFLQDPTVEIVEEGDALPGPFVDVQMTTISLSSTAAMIENVTVRGTSTLVRAPLGTLPRVAGAV